MADNTLTKIEDFLDDTKPKGLRKGSRVGVASPAVQPLAAPPPRPSAEKDTEHFIQKSVPEISGYKTKLPGWTSDDSSSSSPALSPALAAHVGQGVVGYSIGGSATATTHTAKKNRSSRTASFSAENANRLPVPQASMLVSLAASPDAAATNEDANTKPEKQQKGPPPGIEPKPKMTKAERRELQERQRAEKEARKIAEGKPTQQKKPAKEIQQPKQEDTKHKAPSQTTTTTTPSLLATNLPPTANSTPTLASSSSPLPPSQQQQQQQAQQQPQSQLQQIASFRQNPSLFSHLPSHNSLLTDDELDKRRRKFGEIHPATLRLGAKYQHLRISGANSRVMALSQCLKEVLSDYQLPAHGEIRHDLHKYISLQISYLVSCRPLATAMGHFIKAIKQAIFTLPPNVTVAEARELLENEIDSYILEKIVHARMTIVKIGTQCVQGGDVVLVYLTSDIIAEVLLSAAKKLSEKSNTSQKHFKLVVVDARPHFDGKEMVEKMCAAGIDVCYVQLHAVCYVMKEVTKVFLSADSLLVNGSVYGRAGTALIATVANQFKVPVIVLCETYKFSLVARLDSIVANELADPDTLLSDDLCSSHSPLVEWKTPAMANVKLLNLTYDLTPAKFVNMVVTDVGMIPPTSVPVVLREFQKQQ